MGRKKEISDQALLDIARDIFIKEGHTVATGVIAKAAGVSQATLFNRFETKRRLMIKALAPAFGDPRDLLPRPDDARSIPLQLVDVGMTLFHLMRQNEPGVRVLQSAGISFEEIRDNVEQFAPYETMGALKGWFEAIQGRQRVNSTIAPELFPMVFGGAIGNLAFGEPFAQLRQDPQRVMRYITQLVDLLWRGLNPS